jgi:protein-tyrosine phosphatase
VFSFFSSAKKESRVPFSADMHSHLLPGLDDGVKSIAEVDLIVERFRHYGYTKAVTTPHIMNDSYRNTPEGIREKLREVKEALAITHPDFALEAAAEYYLDEALMQRLAQKEELLTFGNKYLLFETNYLTEPYALRAFIFNATTQGYQLVLAHPERYHYMTIGKAEDLIDRGVLLQINLLSLSGFYGKPVQKMAERLIEQRWVHLIGSDCHHADHARAMEAAIQTRSFRKAIELPLLNSTL